MALMNCPECKYEFSDQARECPRCGFPIAPAPIPARFGQNQNLNEQPANFARPWYLSSWIVTFMLFAMMPVGLVLLWMQKPRTGFYGGIGGRIVATMIFVFIYAPFMINFSESAKRASSPTLSSRVPQSPPASTNPGAVSYNPYREPVVTLAEFNRIQTGMSYAKVKAIIGADGAVQSENKIDGIPNVMPDTVTIMYGWQNGDASNMNAMFQNDKLIQKAQFGLK